MKRTKGTSHLGVPWISPLLLWPSPLHQQEGREGPRALSALKKAPDPPPCPPLPPLSACGPPGLASCLFFRFISLTTRKPGLLGYLLSLNFHPIWLFKNWSAVDLQHFINGSLAPFSLTLSPTLLQVLKIFLDALWNTQSVISQSPIITIIFNLLSLCSLHFCSQWNPTS